MRTYRNGIRLCLIMSLFSFTPLILNVIFGWEILSSIENLLLGVFASAFVALITYIGAYSIEKRKTIALLSKYCRDYILEWSNLIPLLMDIYPNGICSFNWAEVIKKVKCENDIHNVVVKLCKIHEERLFSLDGYFPIFRKSENNLTVHKLIIAFAKINCAIQYCDRAYLLNNSVVCKMEKDDIEYSDETLKEYLKVILQNNNNYYQEFLDLVMKVNAMGKSRTIFQKNCEMKCS